MRPLPEYPDLGDLLGTYFNQDYRLFGDTVEELVDAFVDEDVSDEHRVARALSQVTSLLGRGLNDDELAALTLRNDVADIRPEGWGLTTSGWLEAIRARLQERLQQRPPHSEPGGSPSL